MKNLTIAMVLAFFSGSLLASELLEGTESEKILTLQKKVEERIQDKEKSIESLKGTEYPFLITSQEKHLNVLKALHKEILERKLNSEEIWQKDKAIFALYEAPGSFY